ncbi:MAG: hypothetical protein IPI00_13430 [Flavobacteriales bacterium]|nr:hypothetical protein [Flavobacteriales bacterium]MBK6944717.1 hypothetical protein [Flavobacteriales bacterium]MBK7241136.1 hypothetical protein [Flavobacteriales bacterium]MBK9534371.1 hypothetical protein [Flavobacteriales bacterium]MBP9137205.1 hypothetical protein [Flavobacteriales bacterium]
MTWNIKTITPKKVGMEYTAIVTRDKNYLLADDLTATGDMNTRKLKYVLGGTQEEQDTWRLGLIYTGKGPRVITVQVVDEAGRVLEEEKPTVADSHGGGPGSDKIIKIQVVQVVKKTRKVKL